MHLTGHYEICIYCIIDVCDTSLMTNALNVVYLSFQSLLLFCFCLFLSVFLLLLLLLLLIPVQDHTKGLTQ